MKNHLVSDNNCKIVDLYYPNKLYKEGQRMITLHLVFIGDTAQEIVLSKTDWVGDTNYNI